MPCLRDHSVQSIRLNASTRHVQDDSPSCRHSSVYVAPLPAPGRGRGRGSSWPDVTHTIGVEALGHGVIDRGEMQRRLDLGAAVACWQRWPVGLLVDCHPDWSEGSGGTTTVRGYGAPISRGARKDRWRGSTAARRLGGHARSTALTVERSTHQRGPVPAMSSGRHGLARRGCAASPRFVGLPPDPSLRSG
jgi:hypothetical protein